MNAALTVAPVFILIGAGWLLQKGGRLSPQTLKENNWLLYWFALPVTLFRGILSAETGVLQSVSFIAALWLPYVIMLVLVWLTVRGRENSSRFAAIVLCSIRGNSFFAGIPILSLAMGRSGIEAGTLILAFSLAVMQMLSIGGAQFALSGTVSRDTVKNTCLQLLKNPLFMTCFLGLLMVSTGLSALPKWLDETLEILGAISTGLALIGLGAGIRLQNILKSVVSVWKILLFKLVVLPAVTYAVFTGFGLSREMVQAGVLLAGMPVAVNSSIVAQEMGMDGSYCAMAITLSTSFSLFTLPLLIQLLGLA